MTSQSFNHVQRSHDSNSSFECLSAHFPVNNRSHAKPTSYGMLVSQVCFNPHTSNSIPLLAGFHTEGGGPWNFPPPSVQFSTPRKLENLYSLMVMHDAVAVSHKLLPPHQKVLNETLFCVPIPYVNPFTECLLINELTLYSLTVVAMCTQSQLMMSQIIIQIPCSLLESVNIIHSCPCRL